MPARLLGVIGDTFRSGGLEICLADLVALVGASDAPLAGVQTVLETIAAAKIEIVPGIEAGDLQSVRILRPMTSADETLAALDRELRDGEGANIEFKSSLMFNRKRAANQSSATDAELRSEEVIEGSLKTICGFLNTQGGSLLIGVADDGSVPGIEDDFRYVGQYGAVAEARDKWQLSLRSLISTRFHEGPSVNDFVTVAFALRFDQTVARLSVARRKRLACMKTTNQSYSVFVRRGNRTDRLEVYEIEDLVKERLAAGTL